MPLFLKFAAVALWLLLVWPVFPQQVSAGMIGIYGVDKDRPEFSRYPVAAVFVSPKAEHIAAQKEAGRRVFLTLNAFGGSRGWKDFPGARPMRADGEYLEPALGGICPTHAEWRRSRLQLLASWLEMFRGSASVDGIWLDFIRYPGRWEQGNPNIPDTCYCPRCLGNFQSDSGIHIDDQAITIAEKAAWIRAKALLPWTAWKKEQIVSFAREARQVIEQAAGDRKILLGAFLVPQRKSDHAGAVSFRLAQDAGLLAPYIDVFSPMVYHRMVGRDPAWVGEISNYHEDMTNREVWPIIQAEGVGGEEFGRVVQSVAQSAARGLLVFKHKDMQEDHWPKLAQYRERPNLLENSRLLVRHEGSGGAAAEGGTGLPAGWFTAPRQGVEDSTFWYREEEGSIGLTAGYDRQAVWRTRLPDCRPGASYLFSAEFYREVRNDAYPEISVWGRQYRLNTHRMTGSFQKLQAVVACPEKYGEEEKEFLFRNSYPGNTLLMRLPRLVEGDPGQAAPAPPPAADFFPIGIYGANAGNLKEIREAGFNTAVIGMNEENVDACLSLNISCTLSAPREPEKLMHALDSLGPKPAQGRFLFYVNDEPEIHSFPAWAAEDIQRIIKQRFPDAPTSMAIVRPQGIPFYAKGADYFMLDQYPVPNMPMSWLSESMDEAAAYVGRDRLQSVIQAFGDEQHAPGGWPRLPTFEEMQCLALLSVVHGSRGIYFYTYPSISATAEGREDLARLVGRLNSIRTWLRVPNEQVPVALRMTSPNRLDPKGNPAVHCAVKEQHGTQMLICVNTLATYTEAEIDIPAGRQIRWRDYYDNEPYFVVDGNILARFGPYEAKVLLEMIP